MQFEKWNSPKIRSHVVAAAVAACLRMLDLATGQTAQAADTGPTPAEQFKAFLAAPPVVESMVFRIINYDHQTLEDRVASDQLYHARWQSDAFSLQLLKSKEEIDQMSPSAAFRGKQPDFHWQILSSYLVKASSKHNTALYHFGSPQIESIVFQALCLGISVRPGELEWEGNKFKAAKGIRGEAFLSSENRVSKITYNAGGPVDLTIDYQYTTNIGVPFLPNRISISYRMDGHKSRHADIAIDSINLSNETLPVTVFGPERFGITNRLGVYSNDVFYAVFGGVLINSTDPKYQPHLQKKRKIPFGFIFTLMFFMVSLAGLLVFRPNSIIRNCWQKKGRRDAI